MFIVKESWVQRSAAIDFIAWRSGNAVNRERKFTNGCRKHGEKKRLVTQLLRDGFKISKSKVTSIRLAWKMDQDREDRVLQWRAKTLLLWAALSKKIRGPAWGLSKLQLGSHVRRCVKSSSQNSNFGKFARHGSPTTFQNPTKNFEWIAQNNFDTCCRNLGMTLNTLSPLKTSLGSSSSHKEPSKKTWFGCLVELLALR